ncbi:hypothetical protein [Sulfurimonas sp.]|uniref:hypothetical protein n=1 Tax=Sulfurimonas sp. TaxID=2022749 RepID=UPI002B466BFD|nr:hypothetical protein [Sulfurimonas sp.]
MSSIKKVILGLFLVLFITGCMDETEDETINGNKLPPQSNEIINGYKLPPEPDETLNNSTLLGIDSNNNGVRDDVERKIYFKYKKPVIQAYMMQSAKSYPKYLENPTASAKAQETQDEMWNKSSCSGYLRRIKKIEMPRVEGVEFMENAYMNTKDRIRAYIEFNEASSGGSYSIPLRRDYKEENCDFNVQEMLELGK